MPHWFDDLTTNLAGADRHLPRRSFFQIVGAALGAGAASRIPFSGRAFAQTAQSPRITRPVHRDTVPDNCGRRRVGTLVIREASVENGRLTLHRQLSFDRRTQSGSGITTISRGPTVIVKMEVAAAKGGAVNATVTYGSDVQGVRNITLTSKDASAFHGSVDGRAFTADRTTRQTNKVQFVDGRSAPKIVADPKLSAAIGDLAARGKAAFGPCQSAAVSVRSPQPQQQVRDAKTEHRFLSGPGSGWYVPGDDFKDCQACYQSCTDLFIEMQPSLATVFFSPFAAAAAEAAAGAAWAACMAVCEVPYGGCLPVPCDDFTTCVKGDKCFDYEGGRLCCSAPGIVCKEVCCGSDIKSCLPDGTCGCTSDETQCGNHCCTGGEVCTNGVCCKPGNVVCKGVCCDDGQVCNNGVCCTKNSVCGNVCCDELMTCADAPKGICCGFAHPVCNGKCCEPGSQCINGKCCGHDSICGGVCCPNGQTCVDPKTHKCSACPPKTFPCLPDQGAGICCAANVTCCPGVCCKPGEWCNFQGVVLGKQTFACGPPPVPK